MTKTHGWIRWAAVGALVVAPAAGFANARDGAVNAGGAAGRSGVAVEPTAQVAPQPSRGRSIAVDESISREAGEGCQYAATVRGRMREVPGSAAGATHGSGAMAGDHVADARLGDPDLTLTARLDCPQGRVERRTRLTARGGAMTREQLERLLDRNGEIATASSGGSLCSFAPRFSVLGGGVALASIAQRCDLDGASGQGGQANQAMQGAAGATGPSGGVATAEPQPSSTQQRTAEAAPLQAGSQPAQQQAPSQQQQQPGNVASSAQPQAWGGGPQPYDVDRAQGPSQAQSAQQQHGAMAAHDARQQGVAPVGSDPQQGVAACNGVFPNCGGNLDARGGGPQAGTQGAPITSVATPSMGDWFLGIEGNPRVIPGVQITLSGERFTIPGVTLPGNEPSPTGRP